MILEIIEKLKAIAQKMNEDDIALLGFSPSIDNGIQSNLLGKGWWHVLYFGSNDYFQFGLRIVPWKKFGEWPVVAMNEFYSSSTIAPNISKALPFLRYRNLIDSQEYFELIKGDWDNYIKTATPIIEILKSEKSIEDFKEYMFDPKQNNPSNAESVSEKYVKFWEHIYPSPDFKKIRTEIDNMIENENYLPRLKTGEEYGIWQTRLFHLYASRVTFNSLKMLVKKKQTSLLIPAFDEPLCFDSESISVSQLPNNSRDPSISAFNFAEQIVTVEEPVIKNDPLFPAMEELVNEGKNNYTGIRHAEAAAILDDRLGQPKRSWNALISSTYWSGKNSDEALLPVLEAAIYLCKKHKWIDATPVLEYQLELIKEQD
jgi:hypothetical protein